MFDFRVYCQNLSTRATISIMVGIMIIVGTLVGLALGGVFSNSNSSNLPVTGTTTTSVPTESETCTGEPTPTVTQPPTKPPSTIYATPTPTCVIANCAATQKQVGCGCEDKTLTEAQIEGAAAESTCDRIIFMALYEYCVRVFNDGECMLRLGRIYAEGKCGVTKSESMAYYYFKRCAEGPGLPWCLFRNGEYIWSAKGGAVKDNVEAYNNFKLCARVEGQPSEWCNYSAGIVSKEMGYCARAKEYFHNCQGKAEEVNNIELKHHCINQHDSMKCD
eukprot:Nk52_evm90s352 gene=Nk52_evmTU90s352